LRYVRIAWCANKKYIYICDLSLYLDMPTNKNTLSLTMPKKTWILAEAKTRPSKLLLPRQQELLLMLEKQTEEGFYAVTM
jgi:patatin-like phospholipase/acyl hydrolase